MHIANLMIEIFANYVIKAFAKPTSRINGYSNRIYVVTQEMNY